MKYDVFISCKSQDYNIGRQVYEFLTNHRELNLKVFMADKELRILGESDYGDAIDEALDSSTHLIVVASNVDFLKKKTSNYVYYEWHSFSEEIRTGRKKGNIITILTEDIDKNDLPFALRNCQSFPVTEYSSIITYLKKDGTPTINKQTAITPVIPDSEEDYEDLDYEDALVFIEAGKLQNAIHSLQYSFANGNNRTIALFNKVLFLNFGFIYWDDETWNFFEQQANAGQSFAHLAFFFKLLHDKNTYSQAWKHIKSARKDQKNGYAILCEGIAYEKGIGTDPNLSIATNRFKKALEKNVWESCSYIAEMYLRGNDDVKISREDAINYLAEGCEHDDARSWFVLGSIYGEDAHISENREKAIEKYKKAVELHLYEAWIKLGNLYSFNRFSSDYKDEALSCYLEALKNGIKDAHAYIAMQYWEKGRQEDAIIEATKGKNVGNVLSISTLGKFYEEGLQKEDSWIKDKQPDYNKAWDFYREAFQLGGHLEDAISMARLYVKDEYRPKDISWETIEDYLEEGSKVPIMEALELMIEALKKNGKENEVIKYLKIGAESGSLAMKHEYGIHLLSSDSGTALRLIEEAGNNKYQQSIEWLINYYGTPQTYSQKDYEKWMETGADMNISVPLDDYVPYIVENNPEKAKRFLLDKYHDGNIEILLLLYQYNNKLNIDKQWLLTEFKLNYAKSGSSALYDKYAEFLLMNGNTAEYVEFLKNITKIYSDKGYYYSLLKETFDTKELDKNLAVKIYNFSNNDSVSDEIKKKSNILLNEYILNRKNTKILVVNNIKSDTLLLKVLLSNQGFKIYTTNTGTECIDLVHTEKPDLIILGTNLKDINCFDVTVKLKKSPLLCNIPIIITDLNNKEDFIHGLNVGAVNIISKPFDKEEFLIKIINSIIMGKLANALSDNICDYPERNDKILIVDDVISNVLLVKLLLTNEHFQVVTAQDGIECIKQAKEENPDLIIMDVMMPNMNGFDTAVKLKENPKTRNIPIMFLTALNSTQDSMRGYKIGGADFVTKPFLKDDFLNRIINLLKTNCLLRKFLSQ